MIIKLRIGRHRITFTIAKVIDVLGVNSKLETGEHILLWDFDNLPLQEVVKTLRNIQIIFGLPNIYILRSSKPDNYMAYCFKRCSFRKAIAILGHTPNIDLNFYKWGIFRKKWTLRVSAKAGEYPTGVAMLKGFGEEDVTIKDLKSWVKYETLDMHHRQYIFKAGEYYYAPN